MRVTVSAHVAWRATAETYVGLRRLRAVSGPVAALATPRARLVWHSGTVLGVAMHELPAVKGGSLVLLLAGWWWCGVRRVGLVARLRCGGLYRWLRVLLL